MQPIPRCKRMVPATGSSSPAEERNIHHLADKSSNWQSIVRHSFCNDGMRCHGVARCGAADNRRIVWHGVCKCRGSSSRPNIVPGLVGDLFFSRTRSMQKEHGCRGLAGCLARFTATFPIRNQHCTGCPST